MTADCQSDYDKRRENAQGKSLSDGPLTSYPLICMDFSLSDEGFHVAEVPLKNALVDEYDVGLTFEFEGGKSRRRAIVSWLNMGAQEGYCHIEKNPAGCLTARVYGHESFRQENIETIQARFSQVVASKIAALNEWAAHLTQEPQEQAPKPLRRSLTM